MKVSIVDKFPKTISEMYNLSWLILVIKIGGRRKAENLTSDLKSMFFIILHYEKCNIKSQVDAPVLATLVCTLFRL